MSIPRHSVWLGLTTTLLAAAALGIGASATAVVSTRVIDRTFGCTPSALEGIVRATDMDAIPKGAIDNNNPFHVSPGFIGVTSGGWTPGSELVSIRARGWQRFRSTYSAEGVYASNRRCALSRTRVPLAATGLSGVPVRWAKQVTCLGRGRVLIRVRAAFRSEASWLPQNESFDGVRSKVVTAALAIRSERTGRPLAYMELDEDGKTTFWHSPQCT